MGTSPDGSVQASTTLSLAEGGASLLRLSLRAVPYVSVSALGQPTIGPLACMEVLHETPAGLLYSSSFLFFLCAFSIGAFRAFFEAISALS